MTTAQRKTVKISKTLLNKLHFWRDLEFYDRDKLNRLALSYGLNNPEDNNLLNIWVHSIRFNAYGIAPPFPFKTFVILELGENHHQNLKTVAKALPNGSVGDWCKDAGIARTISFPQDLAKKLKAELKLCAKNPSKHKIESIKKMNSSLKDILTEQANPLLKDYVDQLHKTHLDTHNLISNCNEQLLYLRSFPITLSLASRILLIETIIKDLQSDGVLYRHAKLSDNYRIYTPMQGLKKEDREAIFNKEAGYFELDLSACHLNLIQMHCQLNIPNARDNIIKESGLTKAQIKRAINCTLYGSGLKQIQAQLIEDENSRDSIKSQIKKAKKYFDRFSRINSIKFPEQSRADLTALQSSPTYQTIKRAVDSLLARIQEEKGMVDAFGVKLPLTKPKTVLAAVNSSYEKLLLMPVAKLGQKRGFQTCLDHHDGMIVRIKNENRREDLINEMKECVEKKAKELNINNMKLEIK